MKKLIFGMLAFFLCSGSIRAQNEIGPDRNKHDEESSIIFTITEEMPEFPGGQEALFKFLANETRYPAEAKDKNIQGVVYVQFIILNDGFVDTNKITILRGVHPTLDNEAMRVVRSMPRWSPGYQDGKPVSVYYKLPFNFKLQGDAKKQK